MTLDQRRMQKFTAQALQLCCTASVLAITSRVPAIKRNTTNRETVLSQVTPLFGNVSNDKSVFGIYPIHTQIKYNFSIYLEM